MTYKKMTDLDLNGKRVLIRSDLNVPIQDGKITSDQRIKASIPTYEQALKAGASLIVMSHLGRPTEGEYDEQYSLAPVAEHIAQLMGVKVRLEKNYLDGVQALSGEIVVLENVRFNQGEKADDESLSRRYAALCDVFVMDAFGTAHRAQASTHGVARFSETACAGPLLNRELEALAQALDNPARPMLAIVGGSKVSTKLTVLESLTKKVDQLIVGGGIANTFIAAEGHSVGKSLYEADLVETCKRLIADARSRGADIPVPEDVVCGKEFSASAEATVMSVDQVGEDDMIFDVGSKTSEKFAALVKKAGTIVWNGPVGVFEFDQFGHGTEALTMAIADSDAFSIAGGGDTLAAIDKYGVADRISYISTGGGAFLEFLEGKKLPGVAILEEKASD